MSCLCHASLFLPLYFLFLFSLGDRSGNKGKRNRPVSRFAAVDRTCAFRSCYTLFTPYYPRNDFRAGARLTHHGVFHHFSFLFFFSRFRSSTFSSLFARRRKTALTHRLIRYLLPRVYCPFRFSLAYLRAPRRRPPNVERRPSANKNVIRRVRNFWSFRCIKPGLWRSRHDGARLVSFIFFAARLNGISTAIFSRDAPTTTAVRNKLCTLMKMLCANYIPISGSILGSIA